MTWKQAVRLFRAPKAPDTPRPIPDSPTREQQHAAPNRLLCGYCNHPITDETQRIEVSDSHEHTFFNPHGLIFQIGCFRQAPGCLTAGTASMEFTWFPGHAWTLALCGQCQHHLGWMFQQSSTDRFFGLILPRLRRKPLPSG
ncbi:MAG: hypothetical protein G8237_02485 [Magnetococcales bacterium]|nr:hypothetical protein [Magnetococcales bacterium]